MIDVLSETLIDPKAATREAVFAHPRTGRPCYVARVYRAIAQGCPAHDGRRVRLESVRVPGGTRTSREAIARFVAALTGDPTPAAARRTPTRRERDHAAAVAELAAAGIR